MNATTFSLGFPKERPVRRRNRRTLSAGAVLLLVLSLAVPFAAGARSAVLVAYGIVFDADTFSAWMGPDTLRIENTRTGLSGTGVIGEMGTGAYAVALVDLAGTEAAAEGDTIRFTLSGAAGAILNSLHALTNVEAVGGMVKLDLIASRSSSGTGEPVSFIGPALRVFPNPSRDGDVRIVARIPRTSDSESAAQGFDLTILDAAGRAVHSAKGTTLAGGAGIVAWDGRASDGNRVPQGIYFALVKAEKTHLTGRFLLLR
jgi:hypothetical protein